MHQSSRKSIEHNCMNLNENLHVAFNCTKFILVTFLTIITEKEIIQTHVYTYQQDKNTIALVFYI